MRREVKCCNRDIIKRTAATAKSGRRLWWLLAGVGARGSRCSLTMNGTPMLPHRESHDRASTNKLALEFVLEIEKRYRQASSASL